jgi:subtilisin family serine protease
LLWALARGADIVSLSLGIDFTAYAENLVDQGYPVRIATSRALQAYRANVRLFDSLGKMVQTASLSVRGAIIVVAAGNESRRTDDPRFTVETTPPGIAEGFLSVGALRKRADGQAWSVANFSNTGCQLSAPGVRILSAKLGGGLRESSGTSMAAPHVAGILALWMQRLYPDGRHPVGWPKQVIREVRAHLLKLPGCAESDVGAGLVQAPHP